jgi:oligosaccharide reducing-end xylanase
MRPRLRPHPHLPAHTRTHLRRAVVAGVGVVLALLSACGSTVDSLGYDDADHLPLGPLVGPASYPNAFRDVLGKTDAEIASKIAAAFAQLFHGDPTTQAIYFPIGTDRAFIQDILHDDVRTEGIGYGMLVAVQLDKRAELDRLWTYAKTMLRVAAGPPSGYFSSFCDGPTAPIACLDPFGLQQMTMALIFANDRYGRGAVPPTVDYAADARALLTLMRHKQDQNGGVVAGVTDTFDAVAKLVFDLPDVSAADTGRPSIEMPAYYDLWAQATGDPFWTAAATAGRTYWQRTSHPVTGLIPMRAAFTGAPIAGADTFQAEAYRGQINMVLDQIWSRAGGDPWIVDESDRLLRFFVAQGIDTYGASYTIDGTTVLSPSHDASLVISNGVSGLTATAPARVAFIQAVWDLDIPSGFSRYYPGILDLVGLLALGGQLRVW